MIRNLSIVKICMILVLLLNTSCSEEDYIECGLTTLGRLHQEWRLVLILWDGRQIGSNDCVDTECSYFDITFTDSTYNLSYFIVNELGDGQIDTIRHEEQGNFNYEYCHQTNLNRNGGHYPGGFTNKGEIEFRPDQGERYKSNFVLDISVDLRLDNMKIGEGRFETYFSEK